MEDGTTLAAVGIEALGGCYDPQIRVQIRGFAVSPM